MSGEFNIKKWVREAKKIINKYKEIDKIIYQLAFIATGTGPGKLEAYKKLKELVDAGVMSEAQLKKVIEDARRWRQYRLKDTTSMIRREEEDEYYEKYIREEDYL